MPLRSQIIDHMLRVLGESGVSYDKSLHPSVQLCNSTLDTVSEEEQAKGWWFNKETALKLLPDQQGRVVVPVNALDLRLSEVENMTAASKNRYAVRDGMIYDNNEHTFELSTPVFIDCTLLLDIDHVPALMQSYIQHKAAETVFLDEDGDLSKIQKLERRTALAWQALQAAQLKNVSVNSGDRAVSQVLIGGFRPSVSSRNPNYIGGRIR